MINTQQLFVTTQRLVEHISMATRQGNNGNCVFCLVRPGVMQGGHGLKTVIIRGRTKEVEDITNNPIGGAKI
jgi:hypothetical protein